MKRPASIDKPWGIASFTWVAPEGDPFAKANCDRAEVLRLYALQIEAELDRLRAGPAKAAPALTIQDVMTAIDARIGEWIDWSRIDRTIEDKVCDKYRQARLEILDGDRVGINFRSNGRRELPAADIVQAALRGEP